MDFNHLSLGKRYIQENVDPLEVAQGTRDNALTGGERQQQGTANLRQKQKQQMSLKRKPEMSGTTYASEELQNQLRKVELAKLSEKSAYDWRKEIKEAIEDNDQAPHPYVDVMPPVVKREKLMLAQGLKSGMMKKDKLEPTQSESLNFEDALQDLMEVTGLVDKSKPVAGTRYDRPYRTPVGEVKAMKKAQVKGNAEAS